MKLFNFGQNELRVVELSGDPWFVAKDVCDVLEIANPTQAISRLDDDERSMFNIGRQGETNIVNESGLYSLILGSRKSEAKQFKRWITHEVLPSIRKHGAYMTPETIEKTLTNPDFIIQLATELKSEQQKRIVAEAKLEADRPKVLFAESLEVSRDSILIGELAKVLKQNGIDIGGTRLFKLLREEGYLMSKGEQYNQPSQRSMNLKIMEVKTGSRNGSDGTIRITRTTKITGKGQIYFINKFKGVNQTA